MIGVNKQTARLAGALYLIVVVTGIFSLAYVPSMLFDWKDPARTLRQITESESLLRLSLVSSAICYVAFLFLPLVLYRLLAPVGETAAKAMVTLAIVSVPVSMLNLQNKYAVLTLIGNAARFGIDPSEVQSRLMLLLENYDRGILIVTVFWGLWLLPFGWLVFKSGFLPKIFGILLMLGCCGYLINFAGNTMSDSYSGSLLANIASKPAALGEIGICLWLLVRGINDSREASATSRVNA